MTKDTMDRLIKDLGLDSSFNTYSNISKDSWGKKDYASSLLGDWISSYETSVKRDNTTAPPGYNTGVKRNNTIVVDKATTAYNNPTISYSLDSIQDKSEEALFTTKRLTELALSQGARIKELEEKVDKLYKILQADRDESLLKESKKDDSVFLEFFDKLDE